MPQACEYPLPGVELTPEQAKTAKALAQRLVKLIEMPGFRALRQHWADGRAKCNAALYGARTAEDVAMNRRRLRCIGAAEEILHEALSRSIVAERALKAEVPERSEHVPESVAQADQMVLVGKLFGDMAGTAEWREFAQMVALSADAHVRAARHCEPAAALLHLDFAHALSETLVEIQEQIDRGTDAAKWLTIQAEEANRGEEQANAE